MASSPLDRDILPDNVKPLNYDLSLYDLELGGAFSYQGTVSIQCGITRPSKEIILNTLQLKIHSAEVSLQHTKTQQTFQASNISYDAPRQRATISFTEELPASEKALLLIKFEGTMNNDLVGFSRAKYTPAVTPAASVPKEGDSHLMFSTQFESCDARRAFPCFDEPARKASFDFEIEIPEDLVALSNMPEKEIKKSKDGFKRVSFERTPVMSTYLLAWSFGDFEYIEAFTKRKYGGKTLPVRVYTTKGLKKQGQYALDHAPQIIDYYSDIFGIEYPLPKCDLIAVHEFAIGAMENWGLVTFRTTAVLFDEETSDEGYKNMIAYVVAHELAHQWFGNLCTMEWWSELWLNEGFATWVGWLATDHIHKDWQVWGQFTSEGMQEAFTLDSLRSSHPIEVPVKDALDVDQIFDDISYLKGSSVIHMLATYLGQETFLKGVSNYLKAHAYGNARTNDLWSALSEVSGQDVSALMSPWIQEMGFPVLTVSEEPGQISIKQSRYLSTGDATAEDDSTTWWVPLTIKGKADTKDAARVAFTKKQDILRDIDDDFYKLNTDNAGFYRVNYPPPRLAKLSTQTERLSISDKIGIIGDAGALAISGEAATPGLLAFVEGFQSESQSLVWSQVIDSLNAVKSVFSENEAITKGLTKFILKLIGPAVEKVGWEPSSSDDFLTHKLRALLLLTAGLNGHEAVLAEAKRRFELYMSGKDTSAIHPNLRAAILGINVHSGGKAEYEFVKGEWRKTTTADAREIALRALGRIRHADLVSDYLEFAFSEVSNQDMHTVSKALAKNTMGRPLLWNYFKTNFGTVHGKIGQSNMVFNRFLECGLDDFNDLDMAKEIATFFEGRDNRGYDRTLKVLNDKITGRARYKERDAAVILEWLKVHGYA